MRTKVRNATGKHGVPADSLPALPEFLGRLSTSIENPGANGCRPSSAIRVAHAVGDKHPRPYALPAPSLLNCCPGAGGKILTGLRLLQDHTRVDAASEQVVRCFDGEPASGDPMRVARIPKIWPARTGNPSFRPRQRRRDPPESGQVPREDILRGIRTSGMPRRDPYCLS